MFNKLAIIALPRTGSSSLYYYFCDMFPKYRRAFEPLNAHMAKYMPPIEDVIAGDKIIIKHLIPQELNINKNDVTKRFSFQQPNVSIDIINKFQHTILLTRKNKIKLFESLHVAQKTNIWFQKYDGSTARDGIEDFDLYPALMEADKYLSTFSIKYNMPLFYYEDIFFNMDGFKEVLDYVKLPFNEELYLKYIHQKNKYRQDDIV
jgi:hypothetical protein